MFFVVAVQRVSSPSTDLSSRSVFARPFLSSPRRVSLPNLSAGSVSTRPRAFAPESALPRHVFGMCLLMPTSLYSGKCLGQGSILGKCLRTRTRVFAARNVLAGNVSSDAQVSAPSTCLLTPRCLRRALFKASVLHPACFQDASLVFGPNVQPPQATAM